MWRDPDRPLVLAGIGDEAGPTMAEQLSAVAELGWPAIELRTVDGHALSELDDRAFGAVADAVAGMAVVCVDSRIGDWSGTIADPFDADLTELAVLARRCGRLGTRHVRVMSYPNHRLDEREWRRRVIRRLRELALRAEQAGLVLLHENCAGWAGHSAARMLDLLSTVDNSALRLLFDTGNGIAHGYSGLDLLAEIVPYVEHVHVKDGLPTPGGPQWTVPGAGAARVGDCLRTLLDNGYDGALSIEPHLVRQHHLGDRGAGDHRPFVAAGRALEGLLAREVLPACR